MEVTEARPARRLSRAAASLTQGRPLPRWAGPGLRRRRGSAAPGSAERARPQPRPQPRPRRWCQSGAAPPPAPHARPTAPAAATAPPPPGEGEESPPWLPAARASPPPAAGPEPPRLNRGGNVLVQPNPPTGERWGPAQKNGKTWHKTAALSSCTFPEPRLLTLLNTYNRVLSGREDPCIAGGWGEASFMGFLFTLF